MNGSRGILNPRAGAAHFQLERFAPSPDLAACIDRFWIVRWDLRQPYEQETLPWPCVNVVIGSHRPGVHGISTTRFVAKLEGTGFVIGAKFRAGTFRALSKSDVSDLTDRTEPIAEFFDDAEIEPAVLSAADDPERVRRFEGFLRARSPNVDADGMLASRVVDLAQSDPTIRRVDDLAKHVDASPRTLQRLFRAHVGVSPKWVIQRFRVHEAAERLAAGKAFDAAALAQDCGYCDQAHFIRDFKAQIGRTPGEYAALCSSSR